MRGYGWSEPLQVSECAASPCWLRASTRAGQLCPSGGIRHALQPYDDGSWRLITILRHVTPKPSRSGTFAEAQIWAARILETTEHLRAPRWKPGAVPTGTHLIAYYASI